MIYNYETRQGLCETKNGIPFEWEINYTYERNVIGDTFLGMEEKLGDIIEDIEIFSHRGIRIDFDKLPARIQNDIILNIETYEHNH